MKNIILFLMVLMTTSLSAGISSVKLLTYENALRSYRVYTPNGYQPGENIPLVVYLKGFFYSTDIQMEYTQWNVLADKEHFMVAYPEALFDFWNYGLNFPFDNDDVGFLEYMLDDIASNYSVDPTRVYATGISEGGSMTYYMGNHSNRFAALGVVAGGMTKNDNLIPDYPVPVINFRGKSDPISPWNSNGVMKGMGMILKFWVDLNQCNPEPQATGMPDINKLDGARAIRYLYSGGIGGNTVEHYVIEGGGHTWPGSPYGWMAALAGLGNTCLDIDATQLIWNFFKKYSRGVPTGIKETQQNVSFSFYPNPAKDFLTLSFDNDETRTVTVYGIDGKNLYELTSDYSKAQIPVSTFSNGMYFIKVGNTVKSFTVAR